MAVEIEIRTAGVGGLAELQRVFTAASLSNAGHRADLRAHPEHLVFAGNHLDSGRASASSCRSGA